MISRKELSEYRSITGFANLGQLEKDYIQHLVLLILGDSLAGPELVFKGGTCLQKCFGLPRFSEDLDFDFTSKTLDSSVLLEAFQQTAGSINRFGYEAQLVPATKRFPRSLSARLAVKGPLFDGTPPSTAFLTLEIRFDEPVLPPTPKSVTPPYADLRPYSIQVLDLRELLAEKVRALFTRSEPRDLYDLNYLLTKFPLAPDYALVQKKLDFYNKRFTKKEFLSRARGLKKSFAQEMPKLCDEKLVPEFSQAIDRIEKAFA